MLCGFELEPGWYSYWSYPGDYGQASQFQWKQSDSIKIRSLNYPIPQRYLFQIEDKSYSSFIYKKQFLIPFAIHIPKDYKEKKLKLHLDLELYVCKDICLLQQETLNAVFKLKEADKKTSPINSLLKNSFTESFVKITSTKPSSSHFLFKKWAKKQVQDIDIKSEFRYKDKNIFFLHFYFEDYLRCLDVFPRSRQDFWTSPPVLITQTNNSCSFEIQKSRSQIPVLSGLLVYNQGSKKKASFFKSHEKYSLDLLWFILMAFLGGLLLNIMPCVLPILFLKFYSTLEIIHESKAKVIFLNFSYVLGVISSFLALALFIFFSKQAGEALGWGFHLQSPLFVMALSLVFFFMSFYLLNLFQIPTPKFAIQFKNQKMFSHFITGVMSSTAASPCTVPFMASAVGFAFSRSILEVFIIFFFLGLGLSFPYIVLSFFPGWFRYIPKPKKWMELVKKLMSIPLLATIFWLLFIIYKQLSFSLFLWSLLIFPLSGLMIFIQNKVLKPDLKKGLAWLSLFLILFVFFFTWYFNRVLQKEDLLYKQKNLVSQSKSLTWEPFSLKKIKASKKQNQKILVAVGAQWCLTCKFNERIFNDKEVIFFLKEHNIQLYYGDWTNKNSEIESFLSSYGQKGIPFYVIYYGDLETKVLSNFLLKKSFLKSLRVFFNLK